MRNEFKNEKRYYTTSSMAVFDMFESGLCFATSTIVSTIRHASRKDAGTAFRYVVTEIPRAWDSSVLIYSQSYAVAGQVGERS